MGGSVGSAEGSGASEMVFGTRGRMKTPSSPGPSGATSRVTSRAAGGGEVVLGVSGAVDRCAQPAMPIIRTAVAKYGAIRFKIWVPGGKAPECLPERRSLGAGSFKGVR